MKPQIQNQSTNRPEGVPVNCCPRQLMRMLLMLTLAVVILVSRADAVTCTSDSSGNWNTTGTWGAFGTGCVGAPGGIPGAGDDVVIAAGTTVTMNGNPGQALSLTINGTANWTINGRITNVGIGGLTTTAGGIISSSGGGVTGVLNIAGNLSVPAGVTLNVRRITMTVSGTTTVSGTLSHTTSATGTKTYAGLVTIDPGGSWTNAVNEAITYGGGITNNGSFAWGTGVQTVSGGDVTFAGTAWTTGTGSFTFTGGGQQIVCDNTHGFTIPTLTVNNTVTNNCTGGLTVSTALAGNSTLTQAADSILNIRDTAVAATLILTADAANNTVNYYRAGNQTVDVPSGAPATYFHLTLSGSGVKTMPATAMTVLGNFTMSGAAGTSATAGEALTVGGDFTIAAGNIFSASTFGHSVAGNFTNNGTFNADTSTLTLNGTAAQAIGGTSVTAFNNLTISNINAAVSATTSFDTAGTLNMNGGATVLTPAAAAVVGGSGMLTGTGTVQVTLTGSGSDFSNQYTIAAKTLTNLTVEYIGAAAQAVSAITYGHLKINNGSGAALAGNATVDGALTLTSGTLAVGANTLILNGPAIAGTPTNLSTTASSNLTFGGSSAGVFVPGSVTALNNLTVDNINGLTLNSSPSLSGVLTLTNGVVTTNGYTLDMAASCTTAGLITRANGYIFGGLGLHYPGGAATCTFPIGDASYTPLTVAMANVTSALANSILIARADRNDHPDTTNLISGIEPNLSVNCYWTLTAGPSLTFTGTYDATFINNGAYDGGAATASFIVSRKSGGAWTFPALGARNPNDTTATGMTGFGEFAIGEGAQPSLVVTKSVGAYWDPVNLLLSPKSIPGSFMTYSITVKNTGRGAINDSSIEFTDPIPAGTELFVGDLGVAGSGPVAFTDAADGGVASGLCFDYANPGACAGDSLLFSHDNEASYVATFTPDGNNCDPSVTHIKIKLGGIMKGSGGAPDPSFRIQFRVRVK